MTWLRPSRTGILSERDQAEEGLSWAVNEAVERFLSLVLSSSRTSSRPRSLVAAATPPEPSSPLSLGQLTNWWASSVADLDPEIRQVIMSAVRITSDRAVTVLAHDALVLYMSRVNDRLVRGLEPPLPDDAFNRIRGSISTGAVEGWSGNQVADRIAAELSWEKDGPYWRKELDRYDSQIDQLLDPLGEPGAPAREHARLNDPGVNRLQAQRSNAVKHLEAEKSHWQTRAQRIARTESTGAYNYGTEMALAQEGVQCHEWVATRDGRTRKEHAQADGQVVRLGTPFIVGGFLMNQPGDFRAPPELVVHCRCCVIGSEDCTSAFGGSKSTPLPPELETEEAPTVSLSFVASVETNPKQYLKDFEGIEGDGAEYARRAINAADELGAKVVVAKDASGKATGAMALVEHPGRFDQDLDVFTPPYHLIDYTGSVAKGSNEAMLQEAMQIALEHNTSLYLEPTDKSRDYWRRRGATEDPDEVGSYYHGWSVRQIAEVLGLI